MEYRYISTGEYYSQGRGSTAHAMKNGNSNSIERAAGVMAKYVKPGMLLVPMANHVGHATYTRTLADKIAKLSGAEVADVMKGYTRDTFYDIKSKGKEINKEQLGLYLTSNLPKDKQILIIDNVVSTGTTAAAAIDLIPGAIMFAYADVGKAKKIEGLKNITQDYILENKINMSEKLQWFDTYQQTQQKIEFEIAKNQYEQTPALLRLFASVPKDPNQQKTSEQLAEAYVKEFRQAYQQDIKLGTPIALENGAKVSIDIYYQKDNLQPLLTLTHNDNGMIYQERKAFEKNGTVKELGITYPLSETGTTGRLTNFISYSDNDKNVVLEMQKNFDNMVAGIAESIRNHKTKEISIDNTFTMPEKHINMEEIAKGYGFKLDNSTAVNAEMNKEVSVDLNRYIRYELTINKESNNFQLLEYHKTIDDNTIHDVTTQYHQYQGEARQLSEKLEQVMLKNTLQHEFPLSNGKVDNYDIKIAEVALKLGFEEQNPSMNQKQYTDYQLRLGDKDQCVQYDLTIANANDSKTNVYHMYAKDVIFENINGEKQEINGRSRFVSSGGLTDFVKSLEEIDSIRIMKEIENQKPDLQVKHVFYFETAAVQNQKNTVDDFAKAYGLSKETINNFSDFIEVARDTPGINSKDYLAFPYINVSEKYNLAAHHLVTFSGEMTHGNEHGAALDNTNRICYYELHSQDAKGIDETTRPYSGQAWLATQARQKSDVECVYLFNNAIDAMSYAQINNIDLSKSAMLSVGNPIKDREVEFISQLFSQARLYTCFEKNICGEISTLRAASERSGGQIDYMKVEDDKLKLNFATDSKTYEFSLAGLSAEKIIKEHFPYGENYNQHLNMTICYPNSRNFNEDLKQLNSHTQGEVWGQHYENSNKGCQLKL